jgi:hypothetical protein
MSTPLKSPSLKILLLFSILAVATCASAQINIVNFDFGAVSVMCDSGIGLAYQGPTYRCAFPYPMQDFNDAPGFGWTLSVTGSSQGGGNGVTALTTPNSAFNPPPFNGLPFTQAAALQGPDGTITQLIDGFSAQNYTLTFYLGSRYFGEPYDGNQTVEALIDGQVVGTWALSSFTPFTLEVAGFSASAGAHTLQFKGLNHGDHTAFLSYVVISPSAR